MSEARDTEAAVLDVIRRKLDLPELSREQAMQHDVARFLLQAFLPLTSTSDAVQPPNAASAIEEPRSLVGTEAGVRAALEDTYDLSAITSDIGEQKRLRDASDLVTIGGQRRLRLRDQVRVEILSHVIDDKAFKARLAKAVDADSADFDAITLDPVRLPSAWLRCMLSGEIADLDQAPLVDLRAALGARRRVISMPGLPASLPSVEELARRVDLAELLEPLRILIGERGGWQGEPRRDRFVGRGNELRQMRSFVDELGSGSVAEAVSRAGARAKRAFSKAAVPSVLVLQGRGGLGKSTLLAKFVLDHALDQKRPFPFAYLDFDRAGIDADRPHQLLIEIARQISLQFPQAEPLLSEVCQSIRADTVRRGVAEQAPTMVRDPISRFVEVVRTHATLGKRAFLLVLDTLELVQWNKESISRLASFLDDLRVRGLDELRVVASGRADVPELRARGGGVEAVVNISLKPLHSSEAVELATKLGRGILGKQWSTAWSTAIAGKSSDNEARREPLAIRVAVDMIAREEPGNRKSTVEGIRKFGLGAGEDFVARLYELRILNHVRDDGARALAWPGLVVRRVTREIARELLAPLCKIPLEKVDAAFDMLEREVWLVTAENGALRHIPDLRARTLPLMRRKNESDGMFARVSAEAVKFFYERREQSPEDHLEWIYHRLLAGEPPSQVATDIRPDELSLLDKARADFDEGSPAAVFLAARGSTVRLSPRRLRALPPTDALVHLSRTATNVFMLDDESIDQVVLELADRLPRSNLAPELTPWAQALWIKTGLWSAPPNLQTISVDESSVILRSLLYWSGRTAHRLSNEERTHLLDQSETLLDVSGERLGVRSGVYVMALLRRFGSPESFAKADALVAELVSRMTPNPVASTQAALRMAIVLGERSRAPALASWLANRRRGTSQRVREASISLGELRLISQLQLDAAYLRQAVSMNDGTMGRRFEDPDVVGSSEQLLAELQSTLERSNDERLARQLSRAFATRHEDWIVPVGYAVARAVPGKPEFRPVLAGFVARSNRRALEVPDASTADVVRAVRFADEAGELESFARGIDELSDARSSATQELRNLLDCMTSWSSWINETLGEDRGTGIPGIRDEPEDSPPEAPAATNPEDPQKGRWGGRSSRNGRKARAILESIEKEVFYYSVVVESADGSPLKGPVVFHLHPTYQRSIITVRRIINEKQAELRDWTAYGVFAIGVQVKSASGAWTRLEVDLAQLEGLPKRFLDR